MNDFNIQEEAAVPVRSEGPAPKGLYKLVISLGLAKDENGARAVLVAVAVIAIIIAVAYPLFFL
jgi:hypothetical protein